MARAQEARPWTDEKAQELAAAYVAALAGGPADAAERELLRPLWEALAPEQRRHALRRMQEARRRPTIDPSSHEATQPASGWALGEA